MNELNNIFLTIPNSIFLLYDKTSEESFNIISSYYEELIQINKFDNTKFVLVGNKKDLIDEEEEKVEEDDSKEDNNIIDNENKDNENKDNEKKDNENNENRENEKNKKYLNLSDKIKNYCKEKNIMLYKEISGLSGEGVKDLFEDAIKLLLFDISNIKEDKKPFDVSLSAYKGIEDEFNLSTDKKSYHSDEYKKEINRINKKRKVYLCCYRCTIF